MTVPSGRRTAGTVVKQLAAFSRPTRSRRCAAVHASRNHDSFATVSGIALWAAAEATNRQHNAAHTAQEEHRHTLCRRVYNISAHSSPSQRLCYYGSSQKRWAKVVRYLRAVWNPITAARLKRVYNGGVSRTTQAGHNQLDLWAVASPCTAAARTVCLSIIITGVCFRPAITLSDLVVQAPTEAPYMWMHSERYLRADARVQRNDSRTM